MKSAHNAASVTVHQARPGEGGLGNHRRAAGDGAKAR